MLVRSLFAFFCSVLIKIRIILEKSENKLLTGESESVSFAGGDGDGDGVGRVHYLRRADRGRAEVDTNYPIEYIKCLKEYNSDKSTQFYTIGLFNRGSK